MENDEKMSKREDYCKRGTYARSSAAETVRTVTAFLTDLDAAMDEDASSVDEPSRKDSRTDDGGSTSSFVTCKC